jgi:hypothetical protein
MFQTAGGFHSLVCVLSTTNVAFSRGSVVSRAIIVSLIVAPAGFKGSLVSRTFAKMWATRDQFWAAVGLLSPLFDSVSSHV